ncbi:unnamed protein product, partial [Staurois parvus]
MTGPRRRQAILAHVQWAPSCHRSRRGKKREGQLHESGSGYLSNSVSGHLLYCVRSLWSSPVLCPQSLVISCTVSTVSGHLLYCVRSLWSSLLYCVRSLWSSPVLCPQSLVISCTVSAVSWFRIF